MKYQLNFYDAPINTTVIDGVEYIKLEDINRVVKSVYANKLSFALTQTIDNIDITNVLAEAERLD